MKKATAIISRVFGFTYKILPFILGMYRYYPFYKNNGVSLYPFLDSVYSSFKLYSGSTEGGIPVDAVMEIARFLGIAATLSILVRIFNKLKDVSDLFKLTLPDSVAVYGDSVYAELLYKTLSPFKRVRGGEKVYKHAHKYILMFSNDRKNLEFYSKYYDILEDKTVYIMLEHTKRHSIENPNVKIFSLSENCARQYWKDHIPEKSEKIAIIGFGSLGSKILTHGLLMNIIDPNQSFEYHIYGNGSEYRRLHTELDKMAPDKIIFHDDGLYEINELVKMDRIIICENPEDGISTVDNLIAYLPECPEIHVYSPNDETVTTLFSKDKVHSFGNATEICTADMIIKEKATEDARKQHKYYSDKYGADPWERLSCIKRYSNISSADYLSVIIHLAEKQVPFRTLAELEHIRWCRYHYINNWRYGEKRDDSKRIHDCLIPFSDLSKEEIDKDVEAIKSKL